MKNPITLTDLNLCISLEALEELDETAKAKILVALMPGSLIAKFITALVADQETRSRLQGELGIDYELWSHTTDSLRSQLEPLLEPMFREECETLRRLTRNSEALRTKADAVASLLRNPSDYWVPPLIEAMYQLREAYGTYGQTPMGVDEFKAKLIEAFVKFDPINDKENRR